MAKLFKFTANTINGELQEFPASFEFDCDRISPIGMAVIRDYDDLLNIVARKVFLVLYNGETFGTTQFKSISDYDQFIKVNCQCCPSRCIVLLNGCHLQLNGCDFVLDEPMTNECDLLMNGCNMTINGCNAGLN